MWDLPGPGLEPVSPALAGRFLTTVLPGKPPNLLFNVILSKEKFKCKVISIVPFHLYHSSLYCSGPVLNAAIRAFNSYVESPSLRSLYHALYTPVCVILTPIGGNTAQN